MAKPAQFVREVRQEASRVVWPSRKETLSALMTVLVMVLVATAFFFVVDWAVSNLISLLLGI